MNEEINFDDDIINELDEDDNNKKILSQNRSKYVSHLILNFSEKENSKKFDELISDLEKCSPAVQESLCRMVKAVCAQK